MFDLIAQVKNNVIDWMINGVDNAPTVLRWFANFLAILAKILNGLCFIIISLFLGIIVVPIAFLGYFLSKNKYGRYKYSYVSRSKNFTDYFEQK